MSAGPEAISPDDIETPCASSLAPRSHRSRSVTDRAPIAHLKLQIESSTAIAMGLRSSERAIARLLDQLELTLEELESSATRTNCGRKWPQAKTTKVASHAQGRPAKPRSRSTRESG
jgi:hypothetical protein